MKSEASQNSQNSRERVDCWLPFIGVVALWFPAMLAASYSWRNGEYYDYGWFVPPVAIFLLIRRWSVDLASVKLPPKRLVLAVVVVLIPWVLILRVLGYTDPAWRMPIGLLGLTAAIVSHYLIGLSRGWKFSLECSWITLFLLSAVPWPTFIENGLVRELTEMVTNFVAETFQFLGKPVEIVGDRLRLHETTVEVTDGCSGVRSFQSFVMATWFFSEIQRLKAFQSAVLLILACLIAFFINAGRTYGLANVRFEAGQEAFDRAHDMAGLLAFLVSGALFYFLSGYLSSGDDRTVIRTVQQS